MGRIKRVRIRMSTDANKNGGRGKEERCHIGEAAHLPPWSHGKSWLKCGAVMRKLTCACVIPQTRNNLCDTVLNKLKAYKVKQDATGSRLFRVWSVKIAPSVHGGSCIEPRRLHPPSSLFHSSTLLDSLSAVSPGGLSPWSSAGYNVSIMVGSWRGMKLLREIKLLLQAHCCEFWIWGSQCCKLKGLIKKNKWSS